MTSIYVGWLLLVVGILSWLAGLVLAIVEAVMKLRSLSRDQRPSAQNLDLDAMAKLLESLAKALDSLAKLGQPIQWALLSLIPTAVGLYLLVNKPF